MIDVQIIDSDMTANKGLFEKYEFRTIHPAESEQAAEIERICFPPNEACSRTMMLERARRAPECFLVAVDKRTGRLAGFLNGLATDETTFRDEFFTDATLHQMDGKAIMLLGLDVLPEHRGRHLASELVRQYKRMQRECGRELLILPCLDSKVEMYQKMGFQDKGIADSSWGGEEWHEMSCELI